VLPECQHACLLEHLAKLMMPSVSVDIGWTPRMSLYEVNVVRGECGKLGRFYMRRRQFESVMTDVRNQRSRRQ
jgi:hypothetical protein